MLVVSRDGRRVGRRISDGSASATGCMTVEPWTGPVACTFKRMSEDLDLGVAMVVALLAGVALLVVLRRRGSRRPPCATGWIPWVGAGLRFGKAPLEFIEQARARVGGFLSLAFKCRAGHREHTCSLFTPLLGISSLFHAKFGERYKVQWRR